VTIRTRPLGDARRRRHAEDTLTGCVGDDTQLAQLRDASVAHGWAGLLHTTTTSAVAEASAPSVDRR
jgi:hypothetical protein